jgi:hypothetical protein
VLFLRMPQNTRMMNLKVPVSLLRGQYEKDGIPKGTAFPLVKGGVNTPPSKSACGAIATPPKIYSCSYSPPIAPYNPNLNSTK